MNDAEHYVSVLKNALNEISTEEKAQSNRRYFPHGANCIGATAADIKFIITTFQTQHPNFTAADTLFITEQLLIDTQYSEEVLIAFGLINKYVKNNYDDSLLMRFEFWLEHYATNWSLVDDLCIKTIYTFLLARPHLITSTQHWAYSQVPWCRRASNVVWVKFVKRKIGKSTYALDTDLIFSQCNILIDDDDYFVQKSVGWLLKVTSVHHQTDVVAYIEKNISLLTRPTLRYAIEKLEKPLQKKLLNL